MEKNKTTILTFILILLFAGCNERSIQEQMKYFDRGLIPVMYFVKTGDTFRARSAAFYLKYQWKKLQDKLPSYLEDMEEYQICNARMENWLGNVYEAIESHNAPLAAIYLDHANYEMRALRQRHGINYYIDYLYNLQDGVEIMDEVAQDPMLCLLEWNEVESIYEKLQNDWLKYKIQVFDKSIHQFSTEQEITFFRKHINVYDRMEALEDAMCTADRSVIALETKQLKDEVLELIGVFGNFDATKVYYANLRSCLNLTKILCEDYFPSAKSFF